MSDCLQPHGLYSPWNSPGQEWVAFPFFRGSSKPRHWKLLELRIEFSKITNFIFIYQQKIWEMKIYFFIFGRAGSSLLCGLSLVVAGGGCSLAAMLRLLTAVLRLLTAVLRFSRRRSGFSPRRSGFSSWRSGFSSRWLLLLQSMGAQASVVVVHGLSCLATREIFLGQGSNLCPLHWQVDS